MPTDRKEKACAVFMRPDERERVERAAAIADRTIADFVRHAAVRQADQILETRDA